MAAAGSNVTGALCTAGICPNSAEYAEQIMECKKEYLAANNSMDEFML